MIATSRTRPYDARMLAMADRLFTEFEELPVLTVFRAIGRARTRLHDAGHRAPAPAHVETLARAELVWLRVLRATGGRPHAEVVS